jgi:thiol-disulfide isomerase/thioredoxin
MKIVLTLGLAALLASPVFAQNCQLTGDITGLGNKPLLYRYTQQGTRHTDTVRVAANGHFTHVAQPGDDGMGDLYIPGSSRYVGFWAEPGNLLVRGDAAQPGKIRVMGTPENNLLDEHNRTVGWKYDVGTAKTATAFDFIRQGYNQATIQFIKAHPAARTSAHLLYWQLMMNQSYPLAQFEQLQKQLAPKVQQSFQGQQAAKRLLVLKNQPTVGRPVPNFTVADTAGIKHSLATYRGKYVVLDFWGHWCGPCIKSMPKLQALHTQYADKLTVIGIAMEDASDAPLWKQAIRKHGVPGVQLSELQQAKGPDISGYNVTAFPTYMLLDRQGVLLVRTDTFDDITKKLASLADL